VYASPAYGYAQIALAHTCQAQGKQATVFTAKRNQLHPRTLEAKRAGAKVVQVPHGYLSNVKAKAKGYANASGAALLPFGFDFPEFLEALAAVALSLPVTPREVCTVAGSGTLSRALQMAWPEARFYAVQVGATPQAGRAEVIVSPEKFENDARERPPFPSCSNYDAKAWRFVERHASDGALFWNVAA
jgi:cysteine synthase